MEHRQRIDGEQAQSTRRSIWAVEEGLDPPGIFYRKPIPWALSTVCLSSFSKSCGTFPSLELSKLFRESKIVRVWMTILNSNLQWVEALSALVYYLALESVCSLSFHCCPLKVSRQHTRSRDIFYRTSWSLREKTKTKLHIKINKC